MGRKGLLLKEEGIARKEKADGIESTCHFSMAVKNPSVSLILCLYSGF